jgi:hypothetical protein
MKPSRRLSSSATGMFRKASFRSRLRMTAPGPAGGSARGCLRSCCKSGWPGGVAIRDSVVDGQAIAWLGRGEIAMRRHEPSGFGTKPSWEHEMSADDSTQMRRRCRSLAIFVVITLGSASEGNWFVYMRAGTSVVLPMRAPYTRIPEMSMPSSPG